MSNVQLTQDQLGTVSAIWTESTRQTKKVLVNRYNSKNGWGNAETINNGGHQLAHAQINAAPSGDLMAVWEQDGDIGL